MQSKVHLIPHPLIRLGPGPAAPATIVGTDQLCQKIRK
jgi:hypothetical protein